MQLEIIGTDGKVHYTRPHDHPDVWEALNTLGYSVRGTGEKRASGSLQPAGCASRLDNLVLRYKARQLDMCSQMLNMQGVPEWVMLESGNGVPSNATPCRLKWYLARRKDVADCEIDQELRREMEDLQYAKARHNNHSAQTR